jgi:hypothetical protein
MALTKKLWSLSGLAVELDVNVRTIAAALSNVPSDGTIEGGHQGGFLLTALEALGYRLNVRGHKLNGRANGQAAGDSYIASRTTLATERAKLLRLQRREVEGELAPIAVLADALRSMVLNLR